MRDLHQAARKHYRRDRLNDDAVRHAATHVLHSRPLDDKDDPRRWLLIGMDPAGRPLELVMIGLADDASPSGEPVVAQVGVRTRSTLAIGLGAAETTGTRRGVAKAVARALLGRTPRKPAREVLTPVLEDPPSLVPFVVALAPVLARPAAVRRMAARTVADYSITPEVISRSAAAR